MFNVEEGKCPLCGQTNADVLEDHLVAFSGDYDYWGDPIILRLCVNCHRAIHRCCWAFISQESEAILDKYLALLESSLPRSLAQALQAELMAVKDSVIRQYSRVEGYNMERETPGEKECALCGCMNPDFLEEHVVASPEEIIYLKTPVTIDLCGNCHRVVLKFYDGKVLPESEQSKSLLHKYIAEFEEHLPERAKKKLSDFLL